MSDSLEDRFETEISKIKTGPNPDQSITKCMSLLREMHGTPSYHLGEVQPIVNERVTEFCKATGRSYELVVMEMSMARPK